MEEIRQMSSVKKYMDLIDKLAGIIKSHIVINDEEITEIHVLSDTSRSPKQLARDIQSALMVRFGVNVDHKLISIAQIPSKNTNEAHRPPCFRGNQYFQKQRAFHRPRYPFATGIPPSAERPPA